MALRVAVIGVGHLGRHHARILSALPGVELSAVVDINRARAEEVAAANHTRPLFDSRELQGQVDAVTVAVPTELHAAIATGFLRAGIPVLVEKPIARSLQEADQLIAAAAESGVALAVGQTERFNPAVVAARPLLTDPRFIEVHRLGTFPERSLDIDVVFDLMIHDLDVVLSLVKADVDSIEAVGVPVLTGRVDIANARLRFANGCIANLTASRVSAERMRKIRVFSGGPMTSYISLDYRAQEGFIYRLAGEGAPESSLFKKLLHAKDSSIVSEFGGKKIVREPVPITKEEPLKLELQHFVECVRARQKPLVDGEAAMRALDLAFEITRQIESVSARELAMPG